MTTDERKKLLHPDYLVRVLEHIIAMKEREMDLADVISDLRWHLYNDEEVPDYGIVDEMEGEE